MVVSQNFCKPCICPHCKFNLINTSSKVEITKCCQNCGKRIVDDKNNISKYIKTDSQFSSVDDQIKIEDKPQVSETRIYMALLVVALVLAGLATLFGF